ncbi:SAM-dependent methyltransferase [Nocardia sp. NPDC050378]|uniref:SAM-dependent methyltransferase n=1 Tax=Nocardia sp. NPDC050378 TaxID=3155400 RepID=UPI0033E75B05
MSNHVVALRSDIPSTARVGNTLLGGKDNYEVDRLVAAKVSKRFVVALREGRRFLLRAVDYLTSEHAVHQYVELGCGIALPPDIGDAATDRGESARVLYLDHDILAATHAQAMLANSPDRRFALVDITDTATVLDQMTGFLDLGAPLAVCLSGTAELLAEAPRMLAELTTALPPGCWIIFSHITDDVFGEDIRRSATELEGHAITYQPRDRAALADMLAPYLLLPPGLVAPHRWRPEFDSRVGRGFHPVDRELSGYAAVGHLPG